MSVFAVLPPERNAPIRARTLPHTGHQVEPVTLLSGELVCYLCVDCDYERLPTNYMCQECNWVEVTMLEDASPQYVLGYPCARHAHAVGTAW